jgi:putative flippase GtrA
VTGSGDGVNSTRVTFPSSLAPLARQFSSFFWIGLIAAVIHYGCLIGLVELAGFTPVPATLIGFAGGGVASYALNRRYTYASDRPHAEATWRFAVVAFVGFLLTWALMSFFGWLADARFAAWYAYLFAQLVTTGIVLIWSFLAHKFWTFGEASPPLP